MEQATKDLINRVKNNLRVTKVVATRSVKGQRGDSFAGFSAAWNTVQDDGTMGMEDVGDPDTPMQAMTLKEAKIAGYLLAMQADIAAYQHAWAGGSIPKSSLDDAVRTVRANYLFLITEAAEGPQQPKAMPEDQ